MPAALFQIFIEESFQLLERDDVHLIVKIGVVGTGDEIMYNKLRKLKRAKKKT